MFWEPCNIDIMFDCSAFVPCKVGVAQACACAETDTPETQERGQRVRFADRFKSFRLSCLTTPFGLALGHERPIGWFPARLKFTGFILLLRSFPRCLRIGCCLGIGGRVRRYASHDGDLRTAQWRRTCEHNYVEEIINIANVSPCLMSLGLSFC